jgi:hypothetical protein
MIVVTEGIEQEGAYLSRDTIKVSWGYTKVA